MKVLIVFLLVLFFVTVIAKSPLRAAGIKREEPRVGGPCEYHRYEGRAEITSVRRITGPPDQRDEKYEVKFRFVPKEAIKESFAQVEGREFLLEINYSSSLSREFIEEHGIEPGRFFDGYLQAIVKGTCTPTLFEFPSLSTK